MQALAIWAWLAAGTGPHGGGKVIVGSTYLGTPELASPHFGGSVQYLSLNKILVGLLTPHNQLSLVFQISLEHR